jgi:SAM-dependent methyltransferase
MRTGVWNHLEPQILQSIGETSRLHALEVTRSVVPACDGLPNRFHAPGAAMLDIGVGVAGSAIAMAQMWPELRIVGIDPWQPALRLAREHVDRAGLGARFDLREQGVETLDDRAAFDLAWFATHFIPERYVRPGLARTLNALRPGGWIMAGANNDAAAPEMSALSRLRMAQWGGPVWSARDVEKALYDAGFVDVRSLPTRPEALAALVIGRRRPV